MNKLMIILFSIAFFSGLGFSGTFDFTPYRDGLMDSHHPDDTGWNYFANLRLGYESNTDRHYDGWLTFDISAIPAGQTIVSAEIQILLNQRMPIYVDLLEATNPSAMGEGNVTYNSPAATGDTLQSGVWLAPSDWILRFNSQAVVDSVQTYYDNGSLYWGVVMKGLTNTAGGYARWYAREEAAKAVPVLRVEYVPEPTTLALLSIGSIFFVRRKLS